uniref:WD repeat-containing protein 60 n=1 Tax=Megaselia scalaris TaxID=36166 RepID=T1GU74_MEGSC
MIFEWFSSQKKYSLFNFVFQKHFTKFNGNNKINKRGKDLLRKLQLDTISVNFFELKPIPYNTYMKTFGNFNSSQISTQTLDDKVETSVETDFIYTNSVWTQFPAQSNEASGEIKDENYKFDKQFNMYDQNILDIERLVGKSQPTVHKSMIQKELNMSKLNSFLQKTSITDQNIENVYRSDFLNLIMVWSILDGQVKKPIRLLSTWSEVCSADICNQSSDIIVCGLRDGTIALWDLQETLSYCSKLDGHLTHFAPTQTLSPNWGGIDFEMMDLGAMISVKSFKDSSNLKGDFSFKNEIQFASLSDFGIVTVWSLITIPKDKPTTKIENISPWARVKLVQNSICDLKEFLQIKQFVPSTTVFDKRKSYFEKRIFQDDVLKELNEQLNGKDEYKGIRFTALACGSEQIFIGTNRNFIICCTKSLKSERFRKIFINVDSPKSLFTTALSILPNEKFILAGLSNGSVIALNCSMKRMVKSARKAKEHKQEFSLNLESKSCAIQNIILKERRPATNSSLYTLDGTQTLQTFNQDENWITKSVINKFFSPNGKHLYAHANYKVSKFDFESQRESLEYSNENINDICVMNFGKDKYFIAALEGEKVTPGKARQFEDAIGEKLISQPKTSDMEGHWKMCTNVLTTAAQKFWVPSKNGVPED